jgi:hypothetical protein
MADTVFFGNRARCKVLNTWSGGTYTLTNGSTSFTGSASAGDYVWLAADGVQYACKVASAGTLTYAYKGTGGTGAGYKSTPLTLQVLRGLEFNVGYEIKKLWGTDSTFRVDEVRYQFDVTTKAKYCKWDPGVTVDWMNNILRPTGPTGVVEDTNTCFTNGVVYWIIGSDGTSNFEIVCGRTYWENVPYPMPENDFSIRDLTGHAQSAIFNYY